MSDYRWRVCKSPHGAWWVSYKRNVVSERLLMELVVASYTDHDTHAEAIEATSQKIQREMRR